ncbi:hypothetical protein Moror_11057 [Moniliophthora roreri MCA 2997]|uniref:Uncharacterized protein n=1 Tax=Moniliophthora roreri (strain MCA 2997) TaxID=1381753 RepID=V2WWJ7_MONRO|nr:hypothetical protein Moror_11057 [Moniliophthora roreri MCA 2997]
MKPTSAINKRIVTHSSLCVQLDSNSDVLSTVDEDLPIVPSHPSHKPVAALSEPGSHDYSSDSSSSDSSIDVVMAPQSDFVDNGYNKLPTVNAGHISLETFGHAAILVESYLKHKQIEDHYECKLAFLSIFQSTCLSNMLIAIWDELVAKEWSVTDPSFLTSLKEAVIGIDWDDEAGARLDSMKQDQMLFSNYWSALKALNAALNIMLLVQQRYH